MEEEDEERRWGGCRAGGSGWHRREGGEREGSGGLRAGTLTLTLTITLTLTLRHSHCQVIGPAMPASTAWHGPAQPGTA